MAELLRKVEESVKVDYGSFSLDDLGLSPQDEGWELNLKGRPPSRFTGRN